MLRFCLMSTVLVMSHMFLTASMNILKEDVLQQPSSVNVSCTLMMWRGKPKV